MLILLSGLEDNIKNYSKNLTAKIDLKKLNLIRYLNG